MSLAAALVFFLIGAGVMIAVLPAPLTPVDYFTAGTVGTMLGLVAFFTATVRLSKVRNVFHKPRRP